MKSLQQGDKKKINRQPAAPAHYNRMLAASINLQVLKNQRKTG
jgi:hypothetical protein